MLRATAASDAGSAVERDLCTQACDCLMGYPSWARAARGQKAACVSLGPGAVGGYFPPLISNRRFVGAMGRAQGTTISRTPLVNSAVAFALSLPAGSGRAR